MKHTLTMIHYEFNRKAHALHDSDDILKINQILIPVTATYNGLRAINEQRLGDAVDYLLYGGNKEDE